MPDSQRPHGLQPTGSSVHGIFQARVLEWGAIAKEWGSPKYAPSLPWGNAPCTVAVPCSTQSKNADVNLAPANLFPPPHPSTFHFLQNTKPFPRVFSYAVPSSHMLFPLLICWSYSSHCWPLCKLQGQLKCHFFRKVFLHLCLI